MTAVSGINRTPLRISRYSWSVAFPGKPDEKFGWATSGWSLTKWGARREIARVLAEHATSSPMKHHRAGRPA